MQSLNWELQLVTYKGGGGENREREDAARIQMEEKEMEESRRVETDRKET